MSTLLPFFQKSLYYSRDAVSSEIGWRFFSCTQNGRCSHLFRNHIINFLWDSVEMFLCHLLKIASRYQNCGGRSRAISSPAVMASSVFNPPKLPINCPLNCKGKFLFCNALQVVMCSLSVYENMIFLFGMTPKFFNDFVSQKFELWIVAVQVSFACCYQNGIYLTKCKWAI